MQGFNWGGFFGYLGNLYLFEGALTTIWLTAVSITIGLALGFIIALMRLSRLRLLRLPALFYIWLFRGTP
jgi:polar amino acid transport system permease protein